MCLLIFKYYSLIYTTTQFVLLFPDFFLKSIKIETVSKVFINSDDQKY